MVTAYKLRYYIPYVWSNEFKYIFKHGINYWKENSEPLEIWKNYMKFKVHTYFDKQKFKRTTLFT